VTIAIRNGLLLLALGLVLVWILGMGNCEPREQSRTVETTPVVMGETGQP